MSTPVLYLPRLRADQWAIATHPAKVKLIACGRRWGKTTLSGCAALAASAHGGKVAWWVPTYKNARPVWRWVEAATSGLVKSGAVRLNRTERYVRFPYSDGYLAIFSADNDVAGRGDWFNLAVLDEGARIPEATWTEVIQPSLADADGDAIIPSTPAGRNWFWREWQEGAARMDGQLAAFTAPSSANPMPTIKRAYELARERVPDRVFRQEWDAEFLEDSGGVFRRVRDAATATRQTERQDGHRYTFGVDWGKLADFTVIAVIDATTRELVALDRSNRVDYALQVGRLEALYERFRPDAIYAEQNAMGEPIIEQLQRRNLPVHPFQTTNASKAAIIDGLALAFERGELRILDDPVLIGELQAYQAERLPVSGLMRYGAPEGMHDDCVIGLALAWYGASAPTVAFF